MKKTKLSIIASILAVCTLACTACGENSSGDDPKLLQAPDYSKYTHRFDSYGYSGPSDGTYNIDNVEYDIGQDFRTLERYKEYKECGFNIYLAQTDININNEFNEEVWAKEKTYMDAAYEAGLKIILNDQRIQWYSMQRNSIIGVDDPNTEEVEEYAFASEAELDAYVTSCVQLYKDHPGFYGLMLGDEPRSYALTAYGQVYASLKRVLPDAFIQYNLLPGDMGYHEDQRFPELTEAEDNPQWTDYERTLKQYEKYLNMFLDVMPGIEYLQYDDYPIHNGFIDEDYITALQVAAKVAGERGLELHIVSQAFGMYTSGPDSFLHWVGPTKQDSQWMNNVLLGFGVKQIHYFTYWTKGDNRTDGEFFIDGASFMTRGGDRTPLWYNMQEIMANNQKFAPVIKQFNYKGSKSYVVTPTNFDPTQVLKMDNSYTFTKLTDVNVNKEIGLITELYDAENNNYMYMVMNVIGAGAEGSRAYQTTTLTFSDEYTHVVVYKNGVGTPQKLEAGNKLTVKLAATEAVFVLPY